MKLTQIPEKHVNKIGLFKVICAGLQTQCAAWKLLKQKYHPALPPWGDSSMAAILAPLQSVVDSPPLRLQCLIRCADSRISLWFGMVEWGFTLLQWAVLIYKGDKFVSSVIDWGLAQIKGLPNTWEWFSQYRWESHTQVWLRVGVCTCLCYIVSTKCPHKEFWHCGDQLGGTIFKIPNNGYLKM